MTGVTEPHHIERSGIVGMVSLDYSRPITGRTLSRSNEFTFTQSIVELILRLHFILILGPPLRPVRSLLLSVSFVPTGLGFSGLPMFPPVPLQFVGVGFTPPNHIRFSRFFVLEWHTKSLS